MGQWKLFVLLVAVLVAASATVVLLRHGGSSGTPVGSALADPGWVFARGNTQQYTRGSIMMASTPWLSDDEASSLQFVSDFPVYRAACAVHVLGERAFNGDGSSSYELTGDKPPRALGMRGGRPIHGLVIQHGRSNWFDTFIFRVPASCAVEVRGFELHYRMGGQLYKEFLVQQDTFVRG